MAITPIPSRRVRPTPFRHAVRHPVFFSLLPLAPLPTPLPGTPLALLEYPSTYAYCLTKSPSRKLPVITDVTFIDAAVAFTSDPPFLPPSAPSAATFAASPPFHPRHALFRSDYPWQEGLSTFQLSTYLSACFYQNQAPTPNPKSSALIRLTRVPSARLSRIHQRTRVAINSSGFGIEARFVQITRSRLPADLSAPVSFDAFNAHQIRIRKSS